MTVKRDGDSPYHIDGIDYSKHETGYIAYRIGIYGWRKRCLYFLILLVLIMAVVNLAMIIWLLRAQNFGLNGMGKLYITSNGIRVDRVSEFVSALKMKNIITNSPFHIKSNRNITLKAVDKDDNVVGQVSLSSDKIVLKNKELYIKDQHGNVLLHANDEKFKIDIPNLNINVPDGLKLPDKLQSSYIRSTDEDLRVESYRKKSYIKSSKDLLLRSTAADTQFESLKDTKIVAKTGTISLDASRIKLDNLRMSTLLGDHVGYDGVAEVCMCADGRIFLAPPLESFQCKLQSGLC